MKVKEIQEKEKINLQLKNKRKQKLKEKGITLTALVVTIIILLILVGITISQIIGENGLIKRAREAVERYKNASENEQIQLGQLDQYVNDFAVLGKNKELLEAEDTDVLEGKTYIGKNGESTGVMKDYSGEIVEASEITNDGKSTTIMIPDNGFYNTDSKINILNSSLSKFFKSSCEIHYAGLETASALIPGQTYTLGNSAMCMLVIAGDKNTRNINISMTKNGDGSVIMNWSSGISCVMAIKNCVGGRTSVTVNGTGGDECYFYAIPINARIY